MYDKINIYFEEGSYLDIEKFSDEIKDLNIDVEVYDRDEVYFSSDAIYNSEMEKLLQIIQKNIKGIAFVEAKDDNGDSVEWIINEKGILLLEPRCFTIASVENIASEELREKYCKLMKRFRQFVNEVDKFNEEVLENK